MAEYEKIGGGEYGKFFSFDYPGAEVEGEYLGQHEGPVGKIIDLLTSEGPASVGKTKTLAVFDSLAPGTRVKIVFDGSKPSGKGHPLKLFSVYKVKA